LSYVLQNNEFYLFQVKPPLLPRIYVLPVSQQADTETIKALDV